MARMRILSAVEQEAFGLPPVFNSAQRKQYFELSLALRQDGCQSAQTDADAGSVCNAMSRYVPLLEWAPDQ